MCGRFANRETAEKLIAKFRAKPTPIQYTGSHNICPTELAPIILENDHHPELHLARFGIPMQMGAKKFPLINIQSEKARNRKDLKERRCIIPATGFFEWEKVAPNDKQPYFFSAKEGDLAFAGVWSQQGDDRAFSIFTTTANELISPIHQRMPVILGHNAIGAWLDGGAALDTLTDLLMPFPANLMQIRKVSKEVNNVRNKGEQCINSL